MRVKDDLLQVIRLALERFSPYSLLYEQLLNLPLNRPIHVFALGTAAYEMTEAVLYHASQEEYIRIKGGLVITRYGNDKGPLPNMTVLEANHLIADENSLKAGDAAIEFLQQVGENDILVVLLSGGGSSLMEKPAPGYTLQQLNSLIQELYNQGASLDRVEAARKHMSELKGGKLASYVQAREIFIYAMSEVPNDIPKFIASNPFYPDAEGEDNELGLDYYHRYDNLTAEKFKPQEKAVLYKIVANNRTFCEAVRQTAAEQLQFLDADLIHVMPDSLFGDAALNGRKIADIARMITDPEQKSTFGFATPCLLIFGGITTANVVGRGNVGRCTELALAAVEGISGLMNCCLLVYNTSGTEVFFDVAGACVDNTTKQALQERGIDPVASLDKHESYPTLKEIDAVIPGVNSTLNLNEIVLLYIQ